MVEPSNWMSQLPSPLHTAPLWDIAIPGSHDSMTYCLDSSSMLEPNTQPTWLKELEHILPGPINPFIMNWATTQELTIIEQLEAGVRYFDLRIACKPDDHNHTLYFAHGLYTTVTVEETFKDVAQWLTHHPKEVIILACSTFDGLDNGDHQKFIAQLNQLFSKKLCPYTVIPSLQLCWDQKYQVILSYDNDAASGHQELWPKMDYWWANKTSASQVIEYLDNRLQSSGRDCSLFFVAGLNLTEDAAYVLEHLFSSMKEMTLKAYPDLLGWVKNQRCGQGKTCINIIASDFVGVNDFVQLVYQLNWNKLVGQGSKR
ncbi:PI-PLC X domain-containing protein 1-like [Clupea harengus]|uniref:PI-PLC X domain-containing protein 1-like n=1 Tax=Clupea harengus TaxID=7950 RepID=A0A6P8ESM5_CLUHA|nr:PI-PLC X domain-containing protein 1-like [Clupea harengus]